MNPKSGSTEKILIVEENEKQRILLESILDDKGFQCISKNSGGQAITFIQAHGPVGVIFADFTLKEMSGLEFFKMAKNISAESYLILLSCYHSIDNLASHIEKEDIHYFIKKPFHIKEVVEQARTGLMHYSTKTSI
jgi:DNA-binding NtrC family response regulator